MAARKPSRSAQPAAVEPAHSSLSTGLLAGLVSGAVASVLDGQASAANTPAIDRHASRIESTTADQAAISPLSVAFPQSPVTPAREVASPTDAFTPPPAEADAPTVKWPQLEWSDIADHRMPSDHDILPLRLTAAPDAGDLTPWPATHAFAASPSDGATAGAVTIPGSMLPAIVGLEGTWQAPDGLLSGLLDLPAVVAQPFELPVVALPALPETVTSAELSLGLLASDATIAIPSGSDGVPIVAASIPLPIPPTILGADDTWRAPDGLLAELFDAPAFDTPGMATAPSTPPAVSLPTLAEAVAPVEQSIAGLTADAPVAVFDAAIEVVRIGFAGQSYADAVDAHAGPFSPHANLLQGIA